LGLLLTSLFTVDQCPLQQRSALTKVHFDKGLPHQFITKDFLLINLNITTIYKVYILEKVTLEGLGLLDQLVLRAIKGVGVQMIQVCWIAKM
jgi:hypothetical protein